MSAEELPFAILPVGDRLVVRRIQQHQVGAVLMTEGSKDLGAEAELLAPPIVALVVGGVTETVQAGTRIFISRFVGVPIDVDGNEDHQLVIIEAKDVLGIKIEKDKDKEGSVSAAAE